jgi:hypothetical protein
MRALRAGRRRASEKRGSICSRCANLGALIALRVNAAQHASHARHVARPVRGCKGENNSEQRYDENKESWYCETLYHDLQRDHDWRL